MNFFVVKGHLLPIEYKVFDFAMEKKKNNNTHTKNAMRTKAEETSNALPM